MYSLEYKIKTKLFNIYFALKKKVLPFSAHKRKPLILFEFSNYAASQIGGYYFISELLKKVDTNLINDSVNLIANTKKNKNIIEGRWWKINNSIKTSITAKYDKIKDWVMDPKGYFLIKIDREFNQIREGYCKFSKLDIIFFI